MKKLSTVEYITVEPGASNWLIQQTLHSKYGAALPGGSCYSVCAGGHIAGGGYGLLSRLHGLTVDYLAGVEMIIPDATAGFVKRSFDETDADDLNWASRGAGAGHFGIITKYYFRKDKVPAAPERALFVALPVPWSQFYDDTTGANAVKFNQFMKAYYDATESLPGQAFTLGKFTYRTDSTSAMSIVMQVVYGEHSGHDSAVLGGTPISPITTKEDALAVITDFWTQLDEWIAEPETSQWHKQLAHLPGHPVSGVVALDTVYDLPWIDMTQLLNGSGENQNGKYKSSYMISNFVIEESTSILEFLTGTQTDNATPASADPTQTLIQIDSYGLQINSMDADAVNTAVAARSSLLKTQYQTYWKTLEATTPEQALTIENEIVSWFNLGYNTIHKAGNGNTTGFPEWGSKYQGCYFNYPDRQLGVNDGYAADPQDAYGDFLAIYFGDTVPDKLKAIKASIDPDNVFSFSQSVLNPSES